MRAHCFVMSVCDNGRPIAAEKRPLLFSHEGRDVPATASDLFSQEGIGLLVCRKVAHEMGGEVVYIPSAACNVFEITIPQDARQRLAVMQQPTTYIPDSELTELYMAEALITAKNARIDGK